MYTAEMINIQYIDNVMQVVQDIKEKYVRQASVLIVNMQTNERKIKVK
jgi:hypothetical protein